ncbi:MAG: hypothetical protein QXN37_00555 [Candidatus Anstonellaceae archaeon]
MADKNVRYGAEIRKQAAKVDALKSSLFICPQCSKKKVKRKGNSLWVCRSCKTVFAGGAYSLSTPAGEVALRLIEEYKKR